MSRKSGIISSYILQIGQIISSLLFSPFLVKVLGQAEYGIFNLIGSITAYLLLLDLGIGNAIIRYMSKFRIKNEKENQNIFLGLTICFYSIIGVIIILLGFIFQDKINFIFKNSLTTEEIIKSRMMLKIAVINAALILFFGPFEKIIIAFEKFTFSKFKDLLKLIIRIFLSVLVLKNDGDALSIFKINLLMTIIFGVISILFVLFKLEIKPKFCKGNINFIKEVGTYSIFIFIQMIATQINAMADRVLLGIMTSAVTVGIYSIGALIPQYLQSIAGGINGVLMPGVVRLTEKKSTSVEYLNEMIKIGRVLFIILGIIWSVFLVFGQEFINLWMSEKNALAYWVALLLSFPLVLSLTQSIGTQILWAKGEHKIQAYLKIIVSLLNILLTIYLIKWNPLIGASLGTFISVMIGDVVVMNYVYKKYINISIKKYYSQLFRGILLSLLISIALGYGIKKLSLEGWIGFILNCLMMTIIYCIMLWSYGLNKTEKYFLTSTIKKIMNSIIKKKIV